MGEQRTFLIVPHTGEGFSAQQTLEEVLSVAFRLLLQFSCDGVHGDWFQDVWGVAAIRICVEGLNFYSK